VVGLLAFPHVAPAPLIYRVGEGWIYEPATKDAGKWIRTRAKDQLDVAQKAFDEKDYGLSLRAARRTVVQWPLSDYSPDAQYLMGRCYEAKGSYERAFNEYQKILEKFPKFSRYPEVLARQYEIANHFLGGAWFKLWGVIPAFPSMDKTANMYQTIIKNGPYSDVAAQAQLNIGEAREKKISWWTSPDYPKAVKAYEQAADRYHDRKDVSADALYKAGLAYNKQAKTSEYDQNAAAQAIATFNDFMALHPDDPRVPEAKKIIEALRIEQARGNFEIAKYYERKKHWEGALVYYNEVLLKDPSSTYADEAKSRIEILKLRLGVPVATDANPPSK
jgi:outer membrane protein assembly factor BamD